MSELLTYSCSYTCLHGNRFPTDVRATPDTIAEVLAQRNIGETLDDCMPTKRRPRNKPLYKLLERDGATHKTLHHAVFICWQAIRSGAANADDVLGDCGLVHEMVHAMQFGEKSLVRIIESPFCPLSVIGRQFSDLVEIARQIEAAIPGSCVSSKQERAS